MANILEKINKASLRFLEPLSPEETYARILKETCKIVGAKYGSIVLEQEGRLERVYASNSLLLNINIRKKGFTQRAFKNQKAYVADNEKLKKFHPETNKMGAKTVIYIPLTNRNKPFGVLIVQSEKARSFAKKELEILMLLGSMATLAIRKAQLYNETKKALETRDLFISMASHELRTPLTSINGYVQLLKNRFRLSDAPEKRWIEELSWETLRLSNLIYELLQINKVKNGQLDFLWKECRLRAIVWRAISNFKFNHTHHQLELIDHLESGNDVIIGDFDKLLQVMGNLLDNAAKFSPHGSTITIKLATKDSEVILEVIDQGQGIPKNDMARVFERFYKGSSQKTGMGLGLALAKNIIETHHGDLNLRSKPGKGTTVSISLPMVKYD